MRDCQFPGSSTTIGGIFGVLNVGEEPFEDWDCLLRFRFCTVLKSASKSSNCSDSVSMSEEWLESLSERSP